MSRLWDKGEPLSATVARFTVGRDPELDLRLVRWDALASAAHALMLERIGVLTREERRGLVRELAAIAGEAAAGRFVIRPEEEDAHTALENRLTRVVGDAGRKIHTGRSRNDQVLAAIRLWGRDAVLGLTSDLLDLVEQLLSLAETGRDAVVPGYTHTRQAMPSTFGLLFAAHAEGLLDAVPWLETAFAHLDRSPLGSASGYGVGLPLEPGFVAELLAFSGPQGNTLAVQNDRGKGEMLVLGAALGPAQDLARLAADLIWFSSEELGFVRLAPEVTTGSSIMPQKRNPDPLELVRAGAARLRARHAEVAGIVGGLTSGYHRDLQLTKEPFLEGLVGARDLVRVTSVVLEGLVLDTDRAREALGASIGATDEVYRRVTEGRAFRDAYREVAADPEGAVRDDPAVSWRRRSYPGAPGGLDLGAARARLGRARQAIEARRATVDRAWSLFEGLGPGGESGS